MKKGGEDFIVLIPFFLIGVFMFIIGITGIKERLDFFATAIPTEATVVKVNKYDGAESIYYRTLVSYTVNGEEYETEISGKLGRKGKDVKIWYSPEKPDYALSKKDKQPYLITFGGAIFTLIPFLSFKSKKKQEKIKKNIFIFKGGH